MAFGEEITMEFLSGILLIGLCIWGVVWLFQTYTIQILLLIAAVVAIIIVWKLNEAAKRRQAEAAARKAAEEARIRKHMDEQDGYQKQLIVLGDNSITLFEQMPKDSRVTS